jgi:hypothetical protein
MKKSLIARDIEFLKLVVECGAITLDVAQRIHSTMTRSAVGAWIKRLRQGGWLLSSPLDQHRHQYRLSEKAVAFLRNKCQFKVSRAATRPIKPYRKPERQALLEYCHPEEGPTRRLYRPSRDVELFPDVVAHVAQGKADPLRQKLFYREGETIGYLVLDRGHTSFVRQKLPPKVVSLLSWKSFDRLRSAGKLRLTIITVSATRKAELEAEILSEPPPFAWEIVVLAEIAALLPMRVTPPRAAVKEKNNHEST